MEQPVNLRIANASYVVLSGCNCLCIFSSAFSGPSATIKSNYHGLVDFRMDIRQFSHIDIDSGKSMFLIFLRQTRISNTVLKCL